MNAERSGGQEQGILIGRPLGPVTPSQSPVPVGFKPLTRPRSGARAAIWETGAAGGGGGEAATGDGGGGGGGTALPPSSIALC